MINPYEEVQIFENDVKYLPNVSVFVGFKRIYMMFDPRTNEVEFEVMDIRTGEVYMTRKYGDLNV